MDKAAIPFRPIGVIHSPYTDTGDAPIQGVFKPEVDGVVEVFPEYEEGLKDIDGFSHLILIYYFHKAEHCSLITTPYLDPEHTHGVFATRKPSRPNAIGISVVNLVGREGNTLLVKEIDVLDGTPLLDIKPLVPEFDFRSNVRTGWLENILRDTVKDENNPA